MRSRVMRPRASFTTPQSYKHHLEDVLSPLLVPNKNKNFNVQIRGILNAVREYPTRDQGIPIEAVSRLYSERARKIEERYNKCRVDVLKTIVVSSSSKTCSGGCGMVFPHNRTFECQLSTICETCSNSYM